MQKIDRTAADPEMWVALGRGQKLQDILTVFYTRVYEDPRLVPFFHKITKARTIEKQYEFLADLFTGTRKFFGHPPFNAHHWMEISDELFDYRERLFFAEVREHNFPEPLIERWASLHEQFRREIVKPAPRGMYHDGVELLLEGFSIERVTVDTVCDGCMEEVRSGSLAHMHRRTGELFCERCEAREVA